MHTNAPEGISRNHLLELGKKCGLIGSYRTIEMLDAIEGYARVVLADKAVQEAFVAANQHLLKVGDDDTSYIKAGTKTTHLANEFLNLREQLAAITNLSATEAAANIPSVMEYCKGLEDQLAAMTKERDELFDEVEAWKFVAEGEKLDAYQAIQEELAALRAQHEALLKKIEEAEPVAYGLFMRIDNGYYLQFPVSQTTEEVESDLFMYAEGDRATAKVLPLYTLDGIKEQLQSACYGGKCCHDSDCSVHNEPAYPTGECDCSLSHKENKE